MSDQHFSADDASRRPAWTVHDVRGRRSSPEKGLATAHSMTLRESRGTELVVGRLDVNERAGIEADVIACADPMRFNRCPICLEADPSSEEHVPPEAIGGKVMTWTCARCNHRLGSIAEGALVDWWEDAIGSVTFSHDDVQGARKTSRILLRRTASGEPVFLLDRGQLDPEIATRLTTGSRLEITYTLPDSHRYRLAALKSAYLGACLLLRTIPDCPEADAIRAELIAARDVPRRQRPQISDRTAKLRIGTSQGPAVPGEVALVQTRPFDNMPSQVAISLARTLLVSWPLGGTFVGTDTDGTVVTLVQPGLDDV